MIGTTTNLNYGFTATDLDCGLFGTHTISSYIYILKSITKSIYINIRIRRCGMIVFKTTIHQSENEVDIRSGYKQL